jgi:hypothetical protein
MKKRIAKSKRLYEKRVVAFIDILGFSDHIKKTIVDPAHARKIHQVLVQIQELKTDNDRGLLAQKPFGREVSVFSDSIVISYPMSMKSAVHHLLMDIIYLQLRMMGADILMRGGIAIGDIYHNDNIVYGPAMIDAYELESKYAIYPRVILQQQVLAQAALNAEHPPDEELEYLSGLLEVDEDKQIFVDYMLQWEELDEEYDYRLYLLKTRKLIENQLADQTRPDVLLKYNWLKRYYNSTLIKYNHEFAIKSSL